MVKEEKLDFSAKKCEIMLSILNSNRHKYPSIKKIAEDIKVLRGDSYFREIIKYLQEIKIITKDINYDLYIINKSKLKGFIRDQEYVNKWAVEFFRPYFPFP